jgi:hypothetical protein
MPRRSVSVAVVCMSEGDTLRECLTSLGDQREPPPFDVTVICDPRIAGLERVRAAFPDVRVIVNTGQRTPLDLASRAVRECGGEVLLLTKDYCVPAPDWVRVMSDALCRGDRAAVGGRVEVDPGASPTEWAYHYIDFHRYCGPVSDGNAASLTVCNAGYRREALEAVRSTWADGFVETAVNAALASRFGALWMCAASEVRMHRRLTLSSAIRERYAFGRLFGCSRLPGWSARQRILSMLFAPALPALLLARIVRVAARSRRDTISLLRAAAPLTLMVLGRSWGEWLAYLTGRPPRSLVHSA